MSEKRSKDVKKEYGHVHFHQGLLGYGELVDFLSRLRAEGGFCLPAARTCVLSRVNRMIYPRERVEAMPPFVKGLKQVFTGCSLFVEWAVGDPAVLDPDVGMELLQGGERFAGSSPVFESDLTFSLVVDGAPLQFSFSFSKNGGKEEIFLTVNWFFGGFTRMNHAAAKMVRERFSSSLKPGIPQNLAEVRKAAVLEVLTFLQGVELRDECRRNVTGSCVAGPGLWEAFLVWWRENRGKLEVKVSCVLSGAESFRAAGFSPGDFVELWDHHRPEEITVAWNLDDGWFTDPVRDAEEYHRWVLSMADLETASGKAACFTLGRMVATRPAAGAQIFSDGEVLCWFTPRGVVIGYSDISRRKKTREGVEALLTNAAWVKGEPPAEVDAHLPDLGMSEMSEMIPCDVPEQVRKVAALCQKWRRR